MAPSPIRHTLGHPVTWLGITLALVILCSCLAHSQQPPHQGVVVQGEPGSPFDPFPMPEELRTLDLLRQSKEIAHTKSVGCVSCHQGCQDPHFADSPKTPTFHLGCSDCHGGNAGATSKELAHLQPRFPEAWKSSANPVRSYTLLNHENPEFVRFVNPGDLRIAPH